MCLFQCVNILMVKQQNSSAPQPRFASYAYGTTLFRILHVTFAVSCTTFLGVLQVTLTALYSTIIATLPQVFLVTFAASCCNVSTTLFRILHVTLRLRARLFLGLSYSYHGFVLHCQHGSSLDLDNPPSFVSHLLIVCRVVQLLEYCTRSFSS